MAFSRKRYCLSGSFAWVILYPSTFVAWRMAGTGPTIPKLYKLWVTNLDNNQSLPSVSGPSYRIGLDRSFSPVVIMGMVSGSVATRDRVVQLDSGADHYHHSSCFGKNCNAAFRRILVC